MRVTLPYAKETHAMLKRTLAAFILLCLPCAAHSVCAPQTTQTPPTLIIRVASLDKLMGQLDLLGNLFGSGDLGKKLDGTIKSRLGPRGLTGIDANRPLAFYGRIGNDLSDMSGVLMAPVTGEKEFKALLEGLGWEVSPPVDGIYAVKQSLLPTDLAYRVANGYAYLGLAGPDTLKPAALLAPASVFTDTKPAAISLTLRLNQLPQGIRDLLLDGFKEGIGKSTPKDGDPKAPQAIGAGATKAMQHMVESILTDGDELDVAMDIDAKTKQLAIEATLKPKAGSKLASTISKMAERKTLFSGVLQKDAAANVLINLDAPPETRAALDGLFQDTLDKVMGQLDDVGHKNQAKQLIETLKPSLAGGDIDFAVSLRGPHASNKFTFVAGFKLKHGDKLAGILLALIKELPDRERTSVELNVDKAGNVSIHRVGLQKALGQEMEKHFGDNPIYVAFRDDAIFVALGEDGLSAIKQAIQGAPALAPLQYDVSFAKLALLNDNAEGAQKILTSGEDARCRILLEGGPVLRMRMTMSASAFQFFANKR
jgi:hypothetical protein